jgi:uncharacterized protein (DUF58 family)
MDWAKVKRKVVKRTMPIGAYANLDDLIIIQYRARDFSLLPQQPVSSVLSGRYASRLRGRGLNFEELRRYQPGDDIRTMDWKATARTRSPHIKVYSEEKDRAVLLLADQRINMFFGTKERMKSVTAAELTALGAWRALAVGDRVGAVVFNDQDIFVIRPQGSSNTVMRILGAVLEKNHQLRANSQIEPDPAMLNRALKRAHSMAPHDLLLVLISDFFGVDEKTEQLVAAISEHNDVLGLLVHYPIRLEPPAERITISDGTRQIEANLADKSLRKKLTQDYQAEQELITGFLRKLAAPLLPISNQGDVVDQVRRHLGVPLKGTR